MFAVLCIGLCCGLLIGGSIVFACISWITNHVATVEQSDGKYGVMKTDRVLICVRLTKVESE